MPHDRSTQVALVDIGTGTDPDTTYDVSGTADSKDVVNNYMYIPDAMTVDAVHILIGGNTASTTDDINFHLMKYDLDTSTNLGDLSNGVVVADGSAISDVHEDAIKYQSLTVDTSNNTVTAGQIVICTIESTGTDEVSCIVTVKYHLN